MSILDDKQKDPNTILINYEFCDIYELSTKLLEDSGLSFSSIRIEAEAPLGKTPVMERDLGGNIFKLNEHSRDRGAVVINKNFDMAFKMLTSLDKEFLSQGKRFKWRVMWVKLAYKDDIFEFKSKTEDGRHCLYMETVSKKEYSFLTKKQFALCVRILANITYTACYRVDATVNQAESCDARKMTDMQLEGLLEDYLSVWDMKED